MWPEAKELYSHLMDQHKPKQTLLEKYLTRKKNPKFFINSLNQDDLVILVKEVHKHNKTVIAKSENYPYPVIVTPGSRPHDIQKEENRLKYLWLYQVVSPLDYIEDKAYATFIKLAAGV